MKKKTKVNKLLFAALALVAIVTVGFGSWYLFSQSGDSYPTLDDSGAAFQGKSVESRFGYLEFDDQDVGRSNLSNQGLLKKAKQGIGAYYTNEDITASEIIANVQPKEGLKVLFAYYSAEDKGFFTYPVGPFETTEITDPNTFVVPANNAFFISSSDEYEHNYDVLKDTTKPAQTFEIPLDYNEKGWVLVPLSSADDLDNPRIDLAFVMNSDGKFEKIRNLDNADLNGGYIAWLKVREGQEEVVVEEEEEEVIVEEEEEEPIEEVGPAIVNEGGLITAQPIAPIATYQLAPIQAVQIAAQNSAKYLINNIYTDSHLKDAAINQKIDRLEEDFLLNAVHLGDDDKTNARILDNIAKAFTDNRANDYPYIASAIELDIKETLTLNTLEFTHNAYRRIKKNGQVWASGEWKKQDQDWCISSAFTVNLRSLSFKNGVMTTQVLMQDIDRDLTFDAFTEKTLPNDIVLEPGKYVFLIELAGLDACVHSHDNRSGAADGVWTRHTIDMQNLRFTDKNNNIVNFWGAQNVATPVGSVEIQNKDDDRRFYLIDMTPYYNKFR